MLGNSLKPVRKLPKLRRSKKSASIIPINIKVKYNAAVALAILVTPEKDVIDSGFEAMDRPIRVIAITAITNTIMITIGAINNQIAPFLTFLIPSISSADINCTLYFCKDIKLLFR
jgi:hypothetical protein